MLLLCALSALSWTPSHVPSPLVRSIPSRAPITRMDYGDNDYMGAAAGSLPDSVFEIKLRKPLGIQFEEDGPIIGKSGVIVTGLVDGGNAKKAGSVQEGDKLVGVTAVKFVGSKFERQMFDTRKWSFDTVVDAIGSNDEKFNIYDVILQFTRG